MTVLQLLARLQLLLTVRLGVIILFILFLLLM